MKSIGISPRLPIRLPAERADRPRPSRELQLDDVRGPGAVLPRAMRVEIAGGQHTTASILRANRLLREIERTGGMARIVELSPDRSTLVVEVDGAQATSLARWPFVRCIVSLS